MHAWGGATYLPTVEIWKHESSGGPDKNWSLRSSSKITTVDAALAKFWKSFNWAQKNEALAALAELIQKTAAYLAHKEQSTHGKARVDAAIDRVKSAYAKGETLQGWQVDQAARDVIEQAGHGPAFCHRTGHSIGQETHGNGANMDNLETHETRRVLPRTCFSVEPGIYDPQTFGVRSEVNVFVDAAGQVHVTGGEPQKYVIPVLKEY